VEGVPGDGGAGCAVKFQRRHARAIRVDPVVGQTEVRLSDRQVLTPFLPVGPALWRVTDRFYLQHPPRQDTALLVVDRSPCFRMFPSGKVVYFPCDQPSWSRELHLGRPGEKSDNFMTKECVHREGLLVHKPLREQFAQAGYVPLGADRHLFHHPKANPPLYLVHSPKEGRIFYFLRPPPRLWVPSGFAVYCVETRPTLRLHGTAPGPLPRECLVEAERDAEPQLRFVEYVTWSPAAHRSASGDARDAVRRWLLSNARRRTPVPSELVTVVLQYLFLLPSSASTPLTGQPRPRHRHRSKPQAG
jgi:hypothetical protein